MTFSYKPAARALYLVLVVAVLAGCAGQMQPSSTSTRPSDPRAAARQAELEANYAAAAESYMDAAEQTSDPSTQRALRFEAGLAAAQAGRAGMARQILASVQPSSLGSLDRQRYELAQTEIEMAGMPPREALEQLPPPRSGTPPQVAERVWQKRADLHFAMNEAIEGIGALVQRGVWLVDDQALRNNDAAIYEKSLDAIAMGIGPDSPSARYADDTTRGWLALANIGQRRWSSRDERDQALAEWEQQYPHHPATRSVLKERFHYQPSTTPAERGPGKRGPAPRPENDTVALALPLTGDFASAAEAIRDGFMFAYQSAGSAPPKPVIYDTNTMTARDIAERARRDNIGVLVGPLDKPKVANMSRLNTRMPTVALNYTDTPVRTPGFYQFALAPEDEARAVAQHASDQGYRRALALVPKGDWGGRVFDAFRDAFNETGGELVDYAEYDPQAHDHRDAIQSVLRSYHQGEGVDFIFVAAQPTQGRLIRSQLRYYRATNLPMLSTSHIYTGSVDADSDIDLNGVFFVDMPWVIGHGNYIDRQREAAQQQYGDVAQRYSRLFAMGMDAWTLTDRIVDRGLQTGDTFEGMTGILSVLPDGRVRRHLAWGVFRNGKPQLLDMPSESDAQQDTAGGGDQPWAQP